MEWIDGKEEVLPIRRRQEYGKVFFSKYEKRRREQERYIQCVKYISVKNVSAKKRVNKCISQSKRTRKKFPKSSVQKESKNDR